MKPNKIYLKKLTDQDLKNNFLCLDQSNNLDKISFFLILILSFKIEFKQVLLVSLILVKIISNTNNLFLINLHHSLVD